MFRCSHTNTVCTAYNFGCERADRATVYSITTQLDGYYALLCMASHVSCVVCRLPPTTWRTGEHIMMMFCDNYYYQVCNDGDIWLWCGLRKIYMCCFCKWEPFSAWFHGYNLRSYSFKLFSTIFETIIQRLHLFND